MAGNLDRKPRLPRIHFRVLLHAANMGHGTNGFASLPKEGVLRTFSPWKIRRLRPGLNPRTWVPKASMLPLHHRSRLPKSMETFWSREVKRRAYYWYGKGSLNYTEAPRAKNNVTCKQAYFVNNFHFIGNKCTVKVYITDTRINLIVGTDQSDP